MRHPHVRVYSNDHSDAADLTHDYPCQDLAGAQHQMLELVRAYTDTIGEHDALGDVVEFEGRNAVTLWPQGQANPPVHISIQFCEQQHNVEE